MLLVRSPPAPDHEAELRERDALHRLACEAGRTGSWYVSLDTQSMTLSPMAASLLGMPAQETCLPSEIWRGRVDSRHLRGLEAAVRKATKVAEPFDFEFKARRTDGTENWLYVRGDVVRDTDNVPVRVHGGIVDLSEHRRDKDELRRLNETLEHRVAERSRELLDALELLRQSQKLEAMGQLTGGIAHDFNNLLTPIIANLDLLRHAVAGDREQRLIDGALKSANSAQVLVQRLLAFARRQALQPDRVDVRVLVEGMASDLIVRTLGPRIRIELDLAPDLAPALADPNQLEMAILNLSVNARDAMPAGGTLTIRAANEAWSDPATRRSSRREPMSDSPSSTRQSAWTRSSASARSSPSSRPRGSARVPDLACRWSMDSPRRWAVLFAFPARPESVRGPGFGCPYGRVGTRRRRLCRRRRPGSSPPGSPSSSTIMTWCG